MMHPQSQMALEIRIPSTESSLLNDGDYNFHSSTSVAISTQKPGTFFSLDSCSPSTKYYGNCEII